MKNKLIFIALASTLLFVTKTAVAGSEGENYLGIGVQYGILDYNEDGISEEFKPTALIARLGHNFMPEFSVEGRLGFGLQDDTQFESELGLDGIDATLELDSLVGLYAVGHVNLTESFSIYGVLGATRVEGTASLPDYPSVENSETNSGVSYGIGADLDVASNVALNIEYMQYLDKDTYDLGAIGLGVVYSF